MQNDKFRKDADGSFSFNNRNKTSHKWIVVFIIIIVLCGIIIALCINRNPSDIESTSIYESKTSESDNNASLNSNKVSTKIQTSKSNNSDRISTKTQVVEFTQVKETSTKIVTEPNKMNDFNFDRFYCSHCDIAFNTSEASNNGSKYYGYDTEWAIPFSLKNIYINDDNYLVGLFEENYNLSVTESVIEEYKGIDGFIPDYITIKYTIHNPEEYLKDIPKNAMPDRLVIVYSPEGDIAIGNRRCVRVKFAYDDKPVVFNFEFVHGSTLNEEELESVKEYIDEYGLIE